MSQGLSLELFYVDGDPEGLVTAEMFHWTGSVLRFPRSAADRAFKRSEVLQSGVYLLTGEGDRAGTTERARHKKGLVDRRICDHSRG